MFNSDRLPKARAKIENYRNFASLSHLERLGWVFKTSPGAIVLAVEVAKALQDPQKFVSGLSVPSIDLAIAVVGTLWTVIGLIKYQDCSRTEQEYNELAESLQQEVDIEEVNFESVDHLARLESGKKRQKVS